jgi:predicted permease
LRGSARSVGGARPQSNIQRFLIIAQTALSLLLLIGAGLFLQTFRNLETSKAGFNRSGVLLVFVDPARTGLNADRLADFYEGLRRRLKALLGVQSVSFSRISPVSGDRWNGPVLIDGYTPGPNEDVNVFFNAVGPDYFRTLGTPLLQGREFGPQDRENAPKTAIISASLARWLFPSVNPVGKHIRLDRDAAAPEAEVVGVVTDAKYKDLRERETRTVYVPYRQAGLGSMMFEVRTPAGISGVRPLVARMLQTLGNNVQFNMGNLAEQVDQSLVRERLLAVLCTFFGLLALALALVGLYGTTSYAVVRRTNEIGVRIALGAQRRDVVAMVIGQTVALVLIGLAIGVAAALALARVVASLLFGLTANDPFTIVTAAVLMLAMAAVAGYFPARRASRIDPTEALRYE